MSKPTNEQRASALASHIHSVGGLHASAYEVALTLDGRHPGMTDQEFAELQIELQDDIATARAEALHELWATPT